MKKPALEAKQRRGASAGEQRTKHETIVHQGTGNVKEDETQ